MSGVCIEICPLAFSCTAVSLHQHLPSSLVVLGWRLYRVKPLSPCTFPMKQCRKTAWHPNICVTGMCSVLTLSVNPVLLSDTGQKSQWKFFLPLTCLLSFIMMNAERESLREGKVELSKLWIDRVLRRMGKKNADSFKTELLYGWNLGYFSHFGYL